MSLSGDTIQLSQDDSQPHQFNHCAQEPLTKNLTVEGDTAEKIILSCNNQLDEYFQIPLIFHFENATVLLSNLTLVSSHVLGSNVIIRLENCVFESSAIFLMQQEYLEFYQHSSPRSFMSPVMELEIQTAYLLKGTQGEGGPADLTPLSCLDTEITITNAKWLPQRTGTPPPVELPTTLGLQAICHNVSLTMTSSNMADNPIYLFSMTNLEAWFQTTDFEGPVHGSAILGGLSLQSFSYPQVVVEKCSFAKIRYDDVARAHMSAAATLPAALSIELMSLGQKPYSISPRPASGFHLTLSNLTFQNNFRAVVLSGGNGWEMLSHHIHIQIENSLFMNNQMSNSGAAVLINSPRLYVHIIGCEFQDNKAGVNPFAVKLKYVAEPVMKTSISAFVVLGCNFSSENILHFRLYLWSKWEPNITTTTVSKIEGNGGAIAVLDATHIVVRSSQFVNNSANNFGAALYLVHPGYAQVVDTLFLSGDVPHLLKAGLLLFSSSKNLILQNLNFTVKKVVRNAISIVTQHRASRKPGAAEKTLQLLGVAVSCPENSRLLLQNTSALPNIYRYLGLKPLPTQFLDFVELSYICSPCSAGHYSLKSGFYSHHTESVTVRRKKSLDNGINKLSGFRPPPPPPPMPVKRKHLFQYTDVTCNICPYGGSCNGGIQAKANYWGVYVDNTVEFYYCPPGYCCSTAVCATYNTCGNHRQGTLCSQCESGYSEALFSTACVPDVECSHFWFWSLYFTTVFTSALFLLFQNKLESFLLNLSFRRNVQVVEKCDSSENEQEGGVFLVLLFYYFQDASLVHIEPIYTHADKSMLHTLTNFASGLFDFQINITVFTSAVCLFPNLKPVEKIWFKLISVPSIFVSLAVIYVITRCFLKYTAKHFISLRNTLKQNMSTAVLLAILFSYQNLASSAFSLVHCIHIVRDYVLFLDADVKCFQTWQRLVLLYASCTIIPFGLFITVAPSLLKNKSMTLVQFFVGCFCPVPMVLFLLFVKLCRRKSGHKRNFSIAPAEEISSVYETLQGPYRDYFIQLPWIKTIPLCWSGILLLKRLVLILLFTYIYNLLIRLLLMTLVCFLSLLHHLITQPCKNKRDNSAGTISHTALFIVCVINLTRAHFEVMEVIPDQQTRKILDVLQLIEDSLVLWIPLVGASVLVIILVVKLFALTAAKCAKQTHTCVATGQ